MDTVTFRYALILRVLLEGEFRGGLLCIVENTVKLIERVERRLARFVDSRNHDTGLIGSLYDTGDVHVFSSLLSSHHEITDRLWDEEWTWASRLLLRLDVCIPVHCLGNMRIGYGGVAWDLQDVDSGAVLSTPYIRPSDMRNLLSPVQVLSEASHRGDLNCAERYYEDKSQAASS